MARTLNPEELRKPCDPKRFRFVTTSEVASLTRIVGQSRALDAIDFGLGMRSLGFNIYVLGESGTGKTSAIRSFVSEKAIGGVNEKIEGFFDLCRLRGLDGSQGVLIPGRNRRNLVLKDEVVQAAREGTFRILEIDRVEEGVEALMGLPAGEIGEEGDYAPGTLYRKVMDRIGELREAVKGQELEEEKGRKESPE